MATNTDAQFANRFPGLNAQVFNGNMSDLAGWTPSTNQLNTGMLSDIGRASVFAPETQDNFYAKFMKAELGRGDSVMSLRTGQLSSVAYDPQASESELFNSPSPGIVTNVAKKNLSRTIKMEINDRWIKQFTQTEEMYGDVMSAMMSAMNVAMFDDMWVASKEYFSGSTRGAQADQMYVMTNDVTDSGFANEMNELIWSISQNKFGYKSTKYNASQYMTKSDRVEIALKKNIEYPAFKKLYADTFHPDALRVATGIDYVDDFATPAGAPEGAGELIGVIVDPRCYSITPLPDAIVTDAFRNSVRHSTAYFTTYEYIFQDDPFFNKAFIFAPGE